MTGGARPENGRRFSFVHASCGRRPGGYRSFVWSERGKRRLISAAPFADRFFHHAVTAALEPKYERRFLPWSFANRRGRGTHGALAQALRGAARFRWALKLDVQRFFPSADHDVLLGLLRSAVHGRAFAELIARIVASGDGLLSSEWKPVLFPGDDLLALARPKGRPIGNQTSQFFANVLLHPVDLLVAKKIKPGLAARYVDDLLLFDRDRGRLWDVREGVPFVGYRVFPWGAKLPGPSVTRLRQHLRAVAEAYADGLLDLAGAKQRISGLIGHARPARAEAVLGRALEDYPLVRTSS